MKTVFKWECPKCGAEANECGDEKKRTSHHLDEHCAGFICECDTDTEEHGTTLSDPCREAQCYHCGWCGTYPRPPLGLQAWEKKALEAGWTPPPDREKELKKT